MRQGESEPRPQPSGMRPAADARGRGSAARLAAAGVFTVGFVGFLVAGLPRLAPRGAPRRALPPAAPTPTVAPAGLDSRPAPAAIPNEEPPSAEDALAGLDVELVPLPAPPAPSDELAPLPPSASATRLPAWAELGSAVTWAWPQHLKRVRAEPAAQPEAPTAAAGVPAGLFSFVFGRGAPTGPKVLEQILLSWQPGSPKGQRQLYWQRLSDGKQRRVREGEMGAPREISRKLVRVNGLRRAFEIIYEDGTKAIVKQDPLVFDLEGGGVRTSSRKVIYGLRGDSKPDKLQWLHDVDAGMGILAFDADRDGVAGRTGLELFGDQSDVNGDGKPDGFRDGFEALAALVRRASAEGVLKGEAAGAGLLGPDDLAALEAAYGLRMKVGGFNHPAVPLRQAGVARIALSRSPAERSREFDGRGNAISLQQGAVFQRRDGTSGVYANVWLTAK